MRVVQCQLKVILSSIYDDQEMHHFNFNPDGEKPN
jgi:hypothetical protein